MGEEDLNNSFDEFLKGKTATNPGGEFLNKIKTMCSSMGHTGAAAKVARRKAFAMMLKFGLPALMFTISPCDDNMMFLDVATRDTKLEHIVRVPSPNDSDHVLQKFLSHFSDLRHDCPSLAALHFEDIIAITIQHLTG